MKKILILGLFVTLLSCKKDVKDQPVLLDPSEVIKDSTSLQDVSIKEFTEFKVTDSKFIDTDKLWKPFETDFSNFSKATYDSIKPLILEKNIPTLQKEIMKGNLTYEKLVLFYLYRIREYDRNNPKSLNSVISLNPKAVEMARILDASEERIEENSIFGMPILLKDNINTKDLPTTAGAFVLRENQTSDAFITEKLREKGAIILGKTNLSEWAYFFCRDCPSGYSAVGGQTFNPYGRKTIDTGGSSSGSGVAVAANFCVAAVGTETSGSILSPSSQNSVVGLKPTVGLLSRSGIVPISSTLDTPGPMTKSVIDNAILLQSMVGIDVRDKASADGPEVKEFYLEFLSRASVKNKRFGVFKKLKEDSLYIEAINRLEKQGAKIIEIEQPELDLPEFLRLLNLDMKKDLPVYFSKYANKELGVKNISDVINYNNQDSLLTAPYGQKLFLGIINDQATKEEFWAIKDTLLSRGEQFFELLMTKNNLDAVLSVNNFHAGYAAVARYPAITVPMGYTELGVPKGLTIITTAFDEEKLLEWAFVYEKASKERKPPTTYIN